MDSAGQPIRRRRRRHQPTSPARRRERSPAADDTTGGPPPADAGSSGGRFAPLPFAPPHDPAGDPYRTDLVALDFDADGQGWVAGNPAGPARYWSSVNSGPPRPALPPPPSPLVPVSIIRGEHDLRGPTGTPLHLHAPRLQRRRTPRLLPVVLDRCLPGLGRSACGRQLAPPQGRRGTRPKCETGRR